MIVSSDFDLVGSDFPAWPDGYIESLNSPQFASGFMVEKDPQAAWCGASLKLGIKSLLAPKWQMFYREHENDTLW